MGAGVVDQVHVVDARRAGRHAGEARQAAVDMRDDLGVGRPAVLQHVLDQVDAAARRIELVAEGDVGRAGRRAEAAMHAIAQDLFRLRDMRIGELGEREAGLHQTIRPGLRIPCGSNCSFSRADSAASAPACGSNTGDRRALGRRRAHQRRVAAAMRFDQAAHALPLRARRRCAARSARPANRRTPRPRLPCAAHRPSCGPPTAAWKRARPAFPCRRRRGCNP